MSKLVDWLVHVIVTVFRVSEETARNWAFVTAGAAMLAIVMFLWKWLPKLAYTLARRLFQVASYRKAYLESVAAANRHIQLRGMRTEIPVEVELERVYLSLHFHDQGSDLLGLEQAVKHGKGRLLVVGEPGCGKTTMLAWMARKLAMGGHRALGLPRAVLPVIVVLREVPELEGTRLTVESVERAAIPGALRQKRAAPPGFIKGHLERGRCLVLIDGLDEVGAEGAKVVQELDDLVAAFPGNQYVVTSRPFGVNSRWPAGFVRSDVSPLGDDDIRTFCDHWYRAVAASGCEPQMDADRVQADYAGRQLGDHLASVVLDSGNKALRQLATTPLMLTIIAVVHQYCGRLPNRRIELYRQVSYAFLGGRQNVAGIPMPIDRDSCTQVLERLAYNMHEAGESSLPAGPFHDRLEEVLEAVHCKVECGELLRYLCDRAGILQERTPGEFRFLHLTFQEYFAAQYLRSTYGNDAWPALRDRTVQSWWRQPILLYAAGGNPGQLLGTLLTMCHDDETCVPLAGLILAEAAPRMVPDTLGERVAKAVLDGLRRHAGPKDPARSDLYDAALAIAATDACDAASRYATEQLVKQWFSSAHNAYVAGLPPSYLALPRIAEALSEVDQFALPGLCACLRRGDAEIEDLAAHYNGQAVMDGLIEAAKSLRSRAPVWPAGEPNLVAVAASLVGTLREAAGKARAGTRQASTTLVRLREAGIAEAMQELLNDEDRPVREAAIRVLGNLGATQAVEPLAAHLVGGKPDEGFLVVDALAKIGGESAVEALIDCLKLPADLLRRAAATALRSLGSQRGIQAIEAAGL
jgi:hypothetical protein